MYNIYIHNVCIYYGVLYLYNWAHSISIVIITHPPGTQNVPSWGHDLWIFFFCFGNKLWAKDTFPAQISSSSQVYIQLLSTLVHLSPVTGTQGGTHSILDKQLTQSVLCNSLSSFDVSKCPDGFPYTVHKPLIGGCISASHSSIPLIYFLNQIPRQTQPVKLQILVMSTFLGDPWDTLEEGPRSIGQICFWFQM